MKKQKVAYLLRKQGFGKKKIQARLEISFELKLAARLILDEITYRWNKQILEQKINAAIDHGDRKEFESLSKDYQPFTWE